jgi:hypothetical protein
LNNFSKITSNKSYRILELEFCFLNRFLEEILLILVGLFVFHGAGGRAGGRDNSAYVLKKPFPWETVEE